MSGTTVNLANYHLSFDDEFNSFVWSPDGSSGWSTVWANRTVMGDQGYFSDSTVGVNPFSVGSGALTITAAPGTNPAGRPYNTGLITSEGDFRQAYGYFEMRAQLPEVAGMWPAFWMYPGSTVRELDVMEAFGAQTSSGGGSNTYHWGVHDSNLAGGEAGAWVQTPANIYTGYHSYGMLWDPSNIKFYFDGKEVGGVATPSDMNVPMYMLADLAVGGPWPGQATGETAQMKIDYIRAFSSDSAVQAVPLQTVSGPDGGGTDFYGANVGNTVSQDTISLVLSEDAARGQDAKFIVKMDGVQVGGTTTVTASHKSGQTQQFDFTGHWSAGTHQVEIDFLNDLFSPTPRNLYVQSVRYDGASVMSSEVAMHNRPPLIISVTDQTA